MCLNEDVMEGEVIRGFQATSKVTGWLGVSGSKMGTQKEGKLGV